MSRIREIHDQDAANAVELVTPQSRGHARAACRYEVGPCYWRASSGREYLFRTPTLRDGATLWKLAQHSSVLELNSAYAYLLLARHFADTCVIAEHRAQPVGFVSAFISPAARDVVFVWQIAVNAAERGQGLGQHLLHHLLARPACRDVRSLEATVARSNKASQALFRSVARSLRVPVAVGPGFAPELFPGSLHECEDLIRVGPLPRAQRARPIRGQGTATTSNLMNPRENSHDKSSDKSSRGFIRQS